MILGCFMGAGFVSGREVAAYFSRFGSYSVYSIILVTILLFVLILFFLLLSKKTNSFDSFAVRYFGRFHVVANWLLAFCVLILISSMFAGTISLADNLNVNKFILVGITLVLTFFVMQSDVKILSRMNMLIVPFVIFVLIIVSIHISNVPNFESGFGECLFSGSAYVFINIVTLGLFILEIGEGYSLKQKIFISLISSVIIGSLLLLSSRAIVGKGLVGEDMPNLILSRDHGALYYCMQFCVYFGLFSTLCSNVFLLTNFINKYVSNYKLSLLLSLSCGFGISSIGFMAIVGYVYWIIAIIGVVMIMMVIRKEKRIDRKSIPRLFTVKSSIY